LTNKYRAGQEIMYEIMVIR